MDARHAAFWGTAKRDWGPPWLPSPNDHQVASACDGTRHVSTNRVGRNARAWATSVLR